ncbi:MAG TPA: DUF1295 domain-containing protein [Thermoanaerobaculia bacterium]|nr:DUF1295 domain-containing protein [Thermoanaerobaculia bacterium]
MFGQVALAAGAALFVAMVALWGLSLRRRDASIVDIFWGPGFLLVAGLGLWLGEGPGPRRLLVFALVALWALRLASHIAARNLGRGEDYRYREMRERHGARFGLVSLFSVFLLQGAILWVVALPLMAAQSAPSPVGLGFRDLAGALLWATGFLIEAVADRQLARFRARGGPGRVMDRGLWRYSRHPNYFGEAVLWWGLYLVAAGTPGGGWTIVSPLLMTFLLVRVSGVALLEKGMAKRPGWAEYAARTSAFVPLPPRRAAR